MRRTSIVMVIVFMLVLCCACGQHSSMDSSGSEWTVIDSGQRAETGHPLKAEEETENGSIAIDSMYLNTQFSTEYQHLIYVVYDITNDSKEDIVIPMADVESGTGSACILWVNEKRYDDLYPFNEWMQIPQEEGSRYANSGDGTSISPGETVRMISCFQIDTESIGDDTAVKLEFHSEDSRFSDDAAITEVQRVANLDQMIIKQ